MSRVAIWPGSTFSQARPDRRAADLSLAAKATLDQEKSGPSHDSSFCRVSAVGRGATGCRSERERRHALRNCLGSASALRSSGPANAEGLWLLFADSGGTADALAEHIQAAGGSCCRVLAGDTFERISERSWVINPAEPEHFNRLLAQGGWKDGNALSGVIHCWKS